MEKRQEDCSWNKTCVVDVNVDMFVVVLVVIDGGKLWRP
jgi:hypothetical protein